MKSIFSVKNIAIVFLLFFVGLAGNKSTGRSKKDVTLIVKLLDLKGPVIISGKNIKVDRGRGKSRSIKSDSFVLEPEGVRFKIGGETLSPPARISGSGNLKVRGREYRGSFMVVEKEGLILVNQVKLEQYLYGVINNEISSSWPEEAVKAQAVLARSYAMMRREQRKDEAYHLDSTTKDQVYLGAASEDEAARQAVDRTRGIILAYKGKPVEAFYHSSCGGRTETPHYVWGGQDKEYHESVECSFCEEAPHYFWRFPENGELSGTELSRLLGLNGKIKAVRILERSPSGRLLKVRFRTDNGEMFFSGPELRKRLGADKLRSTSFEVKLAEKGLVFFGSGSGHGVGMCQWGARGMAEQGYHHEEILLHYFPGTRISRSK